MFRKRKAVLVNVYNGHIVNGCIVEFRFFVLPNVCNGVPIFKQRQEGVGGFCYLGIIFSPLGVIRPCQNLKNRVYVVKGKTFQLS